METKKESKFFTIFAHEKEEQYLRQQHNAGWRFVKVTGLGVYHFESCQPEDVVYQLDYNHDGNTRKGEYIKMFSDCGWDYIQDYAGYSYFCKPVSAMNGEEEIFCDDSSRIAMMERVYKGRLWPLLVIFCAVLVPQFILNMVRGRYDLAIFMGALLGFYVTIFVYCAVQYYRKKGK